MLGCSLDEAFGGIKKKKNLRNNHANILSRSRLNINENQENNRLDNKIIISDEANKKEEEVKKINNEVRDDVLNKLNVVLNRLSDLEDKFNKNQQALTNQELAGLKAQKANTVHKQITENNNQNNSNTANLINRLNRLRNSNRNNSNRNNSNMNNSNIISNDSIIEGFTNNNISYDGDQLNELLLFGLMGIFILLLFDYIYKLGKKTF